ncbi:MAG TPA: hypothetical protein VKT78_12880 [Fimbriimonadaceae bacterium]|nr:hypothetical protein [Fimbriimonadaceae bacterium]
MKFAAIAAVLLVVTVASAETLKTTATKMADRASAAMAKQDYKGFEAIVKASTTSDFKYVEAGRSMNLTQMMAGIKQGSGMMKIKSAHAKILSCSEKGGKSGSTTTSHDFKGTMTGPDKKPHTLAGSMTSKDTWVKVGGKWKMSVMTVTGYKATMDGKPYNPMAGAPTSKSAGSSK